MANFDQIIFDIEYNNGDFVSNKQLVDSTIFLLRNLQQDHQIPGNDYFQMQGICSWYNEHKYLTNKQQLWLSARLLQYNTQIDPMQAYA